MNLSNLHRLRSSPNVPSYRIALLAIPTFLLPATLVQGEPIRYPRIPCGDEPSCVRIAGLAKLSGSGAITSEGLIPQSVDETDFTGEPLPRNRSVNSNSTEAGMYRHKAGANFSGNVDLGKTSGLVATGTISGFRQVDATASLLMEWAEIVTVGASGRYRATYKVTGDVTTIPEHFTFGAVESAQGQVRAEVMGLPLFPDSQIVEPLFHIPFFSSNEMPLPGKRKSVSLRLSAGERFRVYSFVQLNAGSSVAGHGDGREYVSTARVSAGSDYEDNSVRLAALDEPMATTGAVFYFDAEDPGGFYTTASGTDYTTPIPEPSTLGLLAAAGAVFAMRRRHSCTTRNR